MIETLLGFAALILLLLARVPLGFAMLLVGAVGTSVVRSPFAALMGASTTIIDIAISPAFVVLPLFMLMGAFVTQARLSDDLYDAAHAWLGHFKGGLAMSTVAVLYNDNNVKRIVLAELAELKAAAQHGPPADAMGAAPRRYALTILIPQASKCTDRQFILDAMALLSSDGEASGRAANSVRMTVLTNEQAIFYAEKTD